MKTGQKIKRDKVAIICAWRAGEADLVPTLEDAARSAGPNATIISVEDKTGDGPGRTRHRGIMAAADADVIIIIDAHMRFIDDCLVKMGKSVKKGGLTCSRVYHNEHCAVEGNPYAGARIVLRDKTGREHNALPAKWSKDITPGKRTAVMGACYAFRRDWYMAVGQPLAALPGWGGDEEILSICAWISGEPITCIDAVATHRWRPSPPWKLKAQEYANIRASRMALIGAVCTDPAEAEALRTWQRTGIPEGVPEVDGPEVRRVRDALAKFPRKWSDWRREVCEPEELDIVRPKPAPAIVHVARANYGSAENKRTCDKCGSDASKIDSVRQTGRVVIRYRICTNCGKRRTTQQVLEATTATKKG
jgi:hypothetical protein